MAQTSRGSLYGPPSETTVNIYHWVSPSNATGRNVGIQMDTKHWWTIGPFPAPWYVVTGSTSM